MKTIIKILFSFILLYFVLSQIDINKLLNILKTSNIFYLFIAFVFFNLSKIVSAIRLNYYFREIGINLSLKENLILYYIGMFYNLFLPGGIGGDGYKAYILNKKYKTKYKKLISALLFDRISGLVALLFLGGVLFLFSDFKILSLMIIAGVGSVSIYFIFYFISKKLNKFLFYFKQTTILGLIVQILQLISALFIIYALGNMPIIDVLVLFLISSIVAVLPITIGGVGVRELTFLYGFNYLGMSADSGVAFSFLFFIITMLSSLIGVSKMFANITPLDCKNVG
jgi:uncharacterized membrane protein YbhN (UPF0104 family)